MTSRDSVAGSDGSPVSAGQPDVRRHHEVRAGGDRRRERHELHVARAAHGRRGSPAARGGCRRRPRRGPGSASRPRRRPRPGARGPSPRRSVATVAGSSPNDRIPRCGFAGLVARSHTGAYATFTPIAASSSPVASPTRSASSGSPVAPRAMFPGNGVEPSPSAWSWPPSWSAAISSGPADGSREAAARCAASVSAADLVRRVDVLVAEQRQPGGGRLAQAPLRRGRQRRARERQHQPAADVRRHQPLTAPARPRTKYRCAAMKNSRIGHDGDRDTRGDRPEVGREEALQRGEAHRQRHPVAGVEHQRRPQEVVPRGHEREDRDRGEGRPDDRHHDLPPDPELAGAVDAGRVEQVVGHAAERLAEQEDVERATRAPGRSAPRACRSSGRRSRRARSSG